MNTVALFLRYPAFASSLSAAPRPKTCPPLPAVQFGLVKPRRKPSGFFKALRALALGTMGLTTLGLGSYTYSYAMIHARAEHMSFLSNAQFKFFKPDGKGGFYEPLMSLNLTKVKQQIAFHINEVLQDRPDLRQALNGIPGGIEIRLYQTDAFVTPRGSHVVGLAQVNPGSGSSSQVAMSFATKAVESDLELSSEGEDVVAHELTHVLDFLTASQKGGALKAIGADGYLPGWSEADRAKYVSAREEEKYKIQAGVSPMGAYALTHDHEFLAVLSETFFEQPEQLRESNPDLYRLMADFYRLEPASSFPGAIVKGMLRGDMSIDYLEKRQKEGKYYIWGGMALLIANGAMYLLDRKNKISRPVDDPTMEKLYDEYVSGAITLDQYFGSCDKVLELRGRD